MEENPFSKQQVVFPHIIKLVEEVERILREHYLRWLGLQDEQSRENARMCADLIVAFLPFSTTVKSTSSLDREAILDITLKSTPLWKFENFVAEQMGEGAASDFSTICVVLAHWSPPPQLN